MSYTWEEVMLGIDVRQEMHDKNEQLQNIQDEKDRESELQGILSIGASILGGLIFGPAGVFVGQQFGKWGGDALVDWESMDVDIGKFYTNEARDINRELDEAVTDTNNAQIVGTLIDLGSMWISAGGLEEGFDPTLGGGDWTTFGTGDNAWTAFGRGDAGIPGYEISEVIGDQTITTQVPGIAPSADFAHGLFSSAEPGFMHALQASGKRLATAWQQNAMVDNTASTISTLYDEWQDQKTTKG